VSSASGPVGSAIGKTTGAISGVVSGPGNRIESAAGTVAGGLQSATRKAVSGLTDIGDKIGSIF
jgi:hypothetical protein